MTMSLPGSRRATEDPAVGGTGHLITPDGLANVLPSRPLSSAPVGGWRDVDVQLYRHPSGRVVRGGARDHVLVLNMAGRVVIDDVDDGRRRVGHADGGCFSLTPAGRPVSRTLDGRPEVVLVFLKPALVDAVARDLGIEPERAPVSSLLAVPDPVMHAFGSLLRAEAMQPGAGSALFVDSIGRALTVHLLRTYYARRMPVPTADPALPRRRFAQIVEFMRGRIDDSPSLTELAEQSGLSATHFGRAFRSAFGTTPHAYLVDLRMEEARTLLARTELSVTEIAFRCGFKQSQYFATTFRRKVGVTPSAWRAQVAPRYRTAADE